MEFTALSNYDIEESCKNFKNFKGVFSSDELPKQLNNDECIVYNLQDSTQDGSHWILIANKDGVTINMDSFGLPPIDEARKYMKTCKGQRLYNDEQIQDSESAMCGYYCLYFIQQIYKFDKDIIDVLFEFNGENREGNDKKIKDWYNQL